MVGKPWPDQGVCIRGGPRKKVLKREIRRKKTWKADMVDLEKNS